MTTTSISTSPAGAPAAHKGPEGLIRTVLRLHRWALWVWLAYVALGAGLLLWAWGPALGDARAAVDACAGLWKGGRCGGSQFTLFTRYEDYLRYGFCVIFMAPFLVGAWAAASLTARELETGTAHLAWTQSVTPARWLTAKLAVPAVLVTAGTVPLLVLYRLAYRAGAGLRAQVWPAGQEWWSEEHFTGLGIATVPRVLCAVAVGVLLGLLIRRSLASLGTGVLLMTAAAVKFTVARHLLWPTATRYGYTHDVHSTYVGVIAGEWRVESGAVTRSGDLVPYDFTCMDAAIDAGRDKHGEAEAFYACLKESGLRDVWVAYHPKSHYWPLQFAESGVWLAVAALAVFLSYHLLRRRTDLRKGAA
ncbi:ABC transporter permease [Streptomyces fragilis]|uniref:ABC transporter permease n=1 Tax=Streptomyces fragilis TaxID=67301 RepID=A0ABV2YNY4_9ACTN|nr:ABC transporter permease [Streptomyces fragilis]